MNTEQNMPTGELPSFGFFANQISPANPFPILAQARSMGAVIEVPMSMDPTKKLWLVTRMEEAVEVLKDHKHFTVDRKMSSSGNVFRRQEKLEDRPIFMRQSMINVDEPDHRRLRGLVSKAFTPKYIASLRPSIQRIADELLDRVQEQGQMDLVHDYGYPLPITVISDMLGVPLQMRDNIQRWSEGLVNGEFDGEGPRRVQAFSEYIVELVAEKRRHPGEDLTSQMIRLEDEGDSLTEGELLSMIGLLIFAGHETTSNLISIGALMLLDAPDQFERLKADPTLIPSAIEELLRINGPVLSPTPRFVTENIELAGQQLAKGDMVMVVLASANRDERQFTDPDSLEVARDLNRHIAFGQGIHVCLGAPLARLEGDIAFTTLLRRMPNLKLAIPRDEVMWRGNATLRGLRSLPVTF